MTVDTRISYEQRLFNTQCQRIADLFNVDFMDVHYWWQESELDWKQFRTDMAIIHERQPNEPH